MTLFSEIYANKRVLLTGHTGFKGSWMAAWLVKLGAEVCGFSDQVPTRPSLFQAASLDKHVRDERGDVRDVSALRRLVADFRPDFIFHFAAQAIVSTSYRDPFETFSVNVMGTAAILEAMRDINWPCVGVIITSDKVYDNVEWAWGYRESDAIGGKDVYSGSKGGAELAFKSYYHSFFAKEHPVRIATARAGNVIGGGDWAADRIVADCIRAWQSGATVEIRSPSATRPWQHVLEPLSGYLTLGCKLTGTKEYSGESFNFGPKAEQNATVVELLQELASVWGFEVPEDSYRVVGNSTFYEASLLKLNVDHALLHLRWTPTLNYKECVSMTGEWYRDVVRDGADASTLTYQQIQAYEDLASERKICWYR